MVGHGGSSAGSYLADPTSPIPSHCASIVVTSTVRVNVRGWLIIIYTGCKGFCTDKVDRPDQFGGFLFKLYTINTKPL